MMLIYALLCRLVPRKLVCMAMVYQATENGLGSNATLDQLVGKIG